MRVLLDESVPTALQNLPYQQNTVFPLATIVLVAPNNRVETATKFVPTIQASQGPLLPRELSGCRSEVKKEA